MVKVIIAISSYNEIFYEDGQRAGALVSEILEPFVEFYEKGYDVTIASETGTFGYDEHSFAEYPLHGKFQEAYDDQNSPYNKAIGQLKKASDLLNTDFDVFFAAGGHGAIYDLVHATNLHKIALKIFENNKVIGAVCHGPAIFANLNLSNGQPLIKGKQITGFSNAGEEELGLEEIIKKDKVLTIAEIAKKEGANFIEPKDTWSNFTVVDGNLFTGANPGSAVELAKKISAAIDSI